MAATSRNIRSTLRAKNLMKRKRDLPFGQKPRRTKPNFDLVRKIIKEFKLPE